MLQLSYDVSSTLAVVLRSEGYRIRGQENIGIFVFRTNFMVNCNEPVL